MYRKHSEANLLNIKRQVLFRIVHKQMSRFQIRFYQNTDFLNGLSLQVNCSYHKVRWLFQNISIRWAGANSTPPALTSIFSYVPLLFLLSITEYSIDKLDRTHSIDMRSFSFNTVYNLHYITCHRSILWVVWKPCCSFLESFSF